MRKPARPSPGLPVYSRVTGDGSAGIATFLLDGDDAVFKFERIFKTKSSPAETQNPKFGRVVDRRGGVVDEVVAAYVDFKESPTGNPQIELSCHGGTGVLAALEAALLEAGIERARPTELLERGHLSGKLSLLALEARILLAHAATARQAEFLLRHTALQDRWERLGFEMALGLREKRSDWRERIIAAADAELAASAAAFSLLKRHTIALIGPVNAGKSTLANLLARADRHIVSVTPGTTRDRLDAPLDICGLNVLLTDTAGMRSPADGVEQEGQRRALDAARTADLRMVVLDGSQPPSDADIDFLKSTALIGPMVLVLNKSDLGLDDTAAGFGFMLGAEPCQISAQKGEGLRVLEAQIEARLLGEHVANLNSGAPFTQRQVLRLRQLREGLAQQQHGMDVIEHLRKFVGTRPDFEEMNGALGGTKN